jgi:outer membrane protein OmpA-like peptidoglycan-associated protein
MKKCVTTLNLLLFSFLVIGQSQVKSFYFELNFTEPTRYSTQQFEQFKRTLKSGQVHILEINSFTDSTGSAAANDSLARTRLNYFISRLELDSSVKLNSYGIQRPYFLPKALNSRRVDIVYEIGPKPPIQIASSENNSIEITSLKIEENPEVTQLRNDPEVNEVVVNTTSEIKASFEAQIPFVINVQFKEGTSKILPISYREVTKVAQFMKENPQLKAEIRGHVCCGNNMRISKQRAKSVYKRLIKIGISKERLSYIGKSNTEPLAFPEITETDRQKNRRVDVKFSLMNE